ncbi:MAG: hypothetical protein AAGD43_09360 [Pseudomonadota bacterium]
MNNWPEQFRIAAKDWCDKHAAAELLEETKTATFSQKVAPLVTDGTPVNRAEVHVRASDEWHQYLEEMVAARKAANLAKVKMEWLRMCFKEEEARNYAVRAEKNMTR